MSRREQPSLSDNLIVIGLIGVGMYIAIWYGNLFPFKPTNEGFVGQLWLSWIVISSLSLGSGILIKIINR